MNRNTWPPEPGRGRRLPEPLRLRRFTSGDPTLAERVDDILADNFGDDSAGHHASYEH
ncbi:MAG: hypothetical protein J2P17_12980 [Mycobacterium sp.]|nr:hypothetical protein [Mycobacterium sp.]